MTYEIPRYPVEMIDVVHLVDRDRVIIRPILPQDQELLAEFFDHLSADDRCCRFMHAVSQPSAKLLRQITHVDFANHVALIAEVVVDGRETVVGEARYVRAADPSSAELSLSVAEAWQGRGLAGLMLAKLECRAASTGVRRVVGETFVSNKRMLSFAGKAGFRISETVGAPPGVIRLEKTL